MLKKSQKQSRSALVILVIILMVVVVGSLGFVAWTKFSEPKQTAPVAEQSAPVVVADCEAGGVEKNSTFCSEEIGVKFAVPTVFDGKFKKADNYEIFKGTIDYATRTTAGTSDIVYSAVISGSDNYTLTVAKEPLRSGYVDVGHSLQSTYYDAETGLLSLTNSPPLNYDSATGTYTSSGETTPGDAVPSFMIGDTKFYHGTIGDAGTLYDTYFAVIKGSIVKIKLAHGAYMGPPETDPTTIDYKQVFNEFNEALKNIEVL